MLRHVSIFAVIAISVCLSACRERVTDTTKEALMERTRHWKEPKVAIWYYTGSADDHDYFRFEDVSGLELYRVRSGEVALPRTFPRTADRSQWIVMPWGLSAERSQ